VTGKFFDYGGIQRGCPLLASVMLLSDKNQTLVRFFVRRAT